MLRLENSHKECSLTHFRDMKCGDVGYIRKWPSRAADYTGNLVMKIGTSLFCLCNRNYYWIELDENLPDLLIEVLPKGTKLTFVVK